MVIYQLYVDKFAGNFKGLTQKLLYLKELGIDAIWLLPHYPSPFVDQGYDISDFKNVRTELGTLDDFKKFASESHKLGIKIIIDLVLNHTSTEHPWFKEARKDVSNPKRDYYIWNKTSSEMLSAVNAFPNIKMTNWVYNPFTKDYYFATFYPLQPDLNWDNPEILKEFTDIMDFWIDCGVDGFRLDAITHLIKRRHTLSVALPETHMIVKNIRKHIDSKLKNIMLIGEADLPTYQTKDYFGKGDECNYLFNFESSTRLWLDLKNNKTKVVDSLQADLLDKPKGCSWIYFLDNHDTLALHLLRPEEKEELLNWIDQSRHFGMTHDKRVAIRVGEVFKNDPEGIIRAVENLLKTPGAQVIYYGDEIGMPNSRTEDFALDNRYEVRANFDWAEAEMQEKDKGSILNRIRKLIHISKHQEPIS